MWPLGAPRLIMWYFPASPLFFRAGSAIWLRTKLRSITAQIFKNAELFSLLRRTISVITVFLKESERDNQYFQDISCDQIRVRYLDDENCYMNLADAVISELFRCARDVPGRNWKRISVQAEVWYSPAPPKKREKRIWNWNSATHFCRWTATCNHIHYDW